MSVREATQSGWQATPATNLTCYPTENQVAWHWNVLFVRELEKVSVESWLHIFRIHSHLISVT